MSYGVDFQSADASGRMLHREASAELLSYWCLAVTIRVSPKWCNRQTLKQWHGRGIIGRMSVVARAHMPRRLRACPLLTSPTA